MDFARIKRQLFKDTNRDPLKKAKDLAQADVVERLVQECLPHLAKDAQSSREPTGKP